MRITLLPSSVSGTGKQFLTSYLINDALAIDAGGLGLFGTIEDQARVKHVVISHSHIDHIGSLPIFVDNIYQMAEDAVTIHGSEAVLDSLQRDLFNDRLWPDFIGLSKRMTPFLKLAYLEPGRTIDLEGMRLTPVPVDHVVPTLGFVIEDDRSAVVIASDTGPTEEIWAVANARRNLKGVFLEVSYPNDMAALAIQAKHLTPALFAREAEKLARKVPVIAVHIKVRFQDKIISELSELRMPNLEIGQAGKVYSF